MKHISIAIDGPAGAGKSTLARQAAQRLGFLYVDTGAIYRTVALKALESSADPADPEQVVPLLDGLNVKMDHGPDGGQRMFLDGKDVSDAIRQHRVSGAASQVAAIPQVREFLLDFQRRQAREHDVLMDGRDIGTVVLPDADVKIFLTAAPEARAHRRARELELGEGRLRDHSPRHHPPGRAGPEPACGPPASGGGCGAGGYHPTEPGGEPGGPAGRH